MRDRFIITGLPRSRTGWLANLFTYGSSFCLHDGLRFGADFWGAVNLPSYVNHFGNSDSGIPLAMDSIPEGVKAIFVLRKRNEAAESFNEYFEAHPYSFGHNRLLVPVMFEVLAKKLTNLIATTPNSKIIRFDELESVDVVEKLWNFIVPEERFSRARFDILDTLRVNPASEKVKV